MEGKNADEEGTSDAPDDPGESDSPEGGELNAISLARIRDELYKSVAKGDGKLSRCSRLLLKYLDQNKYEFTSADFEKDIPVTAAQAGNLVTLLKAKGLLAPTGKEGEYTIYTIQPAFPPLAEEDYSTELLLQIRELAASSSSPKDKRLGAILLGCLPKGLITVEDYMTSGRWNHLNDHQAIVIGGAYSVDKFYRLERGVPWLSDEQPSAEIKAAVENRLDFLGWKVDLVLSHTCPTKYIPVECFLPFVDQSTVDRSTEDWLDGIEDRLDYKQWFCGHWHIDKRIDRLHFLFSRSIIFLGNCETPRGSNSKFLK